MRKIMVALLLALVLGQAPLRAENDAQDSQFLSDFTDCLYKLKVASGYDVKDVPYTVMFKNITDQLFAFKDAKGLMEKWMDNQDRRIRISSVYMHGIISVLENTDNKLIGALSVPLEANADDITKYVSQHQEYWNKLYEATGYALWAVIKPEKDKSPDKAIPFSISHKERQSAEKYINKVFKEEFQEYKDLVDRKNKGLIKEFKLSAPVWAALYLRSLLAADTYGDIDKISPFSLTP